MGNKFGLSLTCHVGSFAFFFAIYEPSSNMGITDCPSIYVFAGLLATIRRLSQVWNSLRITINQIKMLGCKEIIRTGLEC